MFIWTLTKTLCSERPEAQNRRRTGAVRHHCHEVIQYTTGILSNLKWNHSVSPFSLSLKRYVIRGFLLCRVVWLCKARIQLIFNLFLTINLTPCFTGYSTELTRSLLLLCDSQIIVAVVVVCMRDLQCNFVLNRSVRATTTLFLRLFQTDCRSVCTRTVLQTHSLRSIYIGCTPQAPSNVSLHRHLEGECLGWHPRSTGIRYMYIVACPPPLPVATKLSWKPIICQKYWPCR